MSYLKCFFLKKKKKERNYLNALLEFEERL